MSNLCFKARLNTYISQPITDIFELRYKPWAFAVCYWILGKRTGLQITIYTFTNKELSGGVTVMVSSQIITQVQSRSNAVKIAAYYILKGRRVIRISGSLIWSKFLMELIFNPCGEFQWGMEGPVSQIHFHLQAGASGIFSDLLRSVQMVKREWDVESNGKLPQLLIPSKTATLFPEFVVEELQPRFLHLQWSTWPSAEHTDDHESGEILGTNVCSWETGTSGNLNLVG